MSLFARYDRVAQHVQDKVFGATFEHLPRRPAANVNAPPEADPDRVSVFVVGIWTNAVTPPALDNLADGTMNRRPGRVLRNETIDVADPNVDLRRLDMLVDVATGRRWMIESVDRDDHGRRLCRVNSV